MFLEDMLNADFSYSFYILNNNFDHKEIICNLKNVRSRKTNFRILYNERIGRFTAHSIKNQTLINIIDKLINFSSKLYKASCENKFKMFVCHTGKLKLIQFLGQMPKCSRM